MGMAVVNISCQKLQHFDLLLFETREEQVNCTKADTPWSVTLGWLPPRSSARWALTSAPGACGTKRCDRSARRLNWEPGLLTRMWTLPLFFQQERE